LIPAGVAAINPIDTANPPASITARIVCFMVLVPD
jgi:hypothetical protein